MSTPTTYYGVEYPNLSRKLKQGDRVRIVQLTDVDDHSMVWHTTEELQASATNKVISAAEADYLNELLGQKATVADPTICDYYDLTLICDNGEEIAILYSDIELLTHDDCPVCDAKRPIAEHNAFRGADHQRMTFGVCGHVVNKPHTNNK